MRKQLLDLIHCPVCQGENFRLTPTEENATEIRQGQVQCLACHSQFDITEGILNLLLAPTPAILNEQRGWSALEKMVTNTDELMLSLSDGIGEHKSAWAVLANNFHYMWPQLKLKGGERVLDLGSGRCWSTRFFARSGCYAVGIDVLLTKYVGLLTADVYINQEGVYFERVCGDMNDLPFRKERFDLIFVNATLHHSTDLSMTVRQMNRVLKPGGRIVIISEPVVGLFQGKELDCEEVKQGINEHLLALGVFARAAQGGMGVSSLSLYRVISSDTDYS